MTTKTADHRPGDDRALFGRLWFLRRRRILRRQLSIVAQPMNLGIVWLTADS
jgi:hypothetical protein